jgi:hypothetical protein
MNEVVEMASQALIGNFHAKKVGESTLKLWLQDIWAPQLGCIPKQGF